MDFSSICRTCIGTKYLNPIFKEGDDHDTLSFTVLITTGLKVEIDDGLPQQICKNCLKFLKDALKFRQLCKEAEIQLLAIKNSQENHENELRNIKLLKPFSRKRKTKDTKSNSSLIKVEIEPDFENDDDAPLLQKEIHFTNLTVSKHKNVKSETVFVKIDNIGLESNSEFVKNYKIEPQVPSEYIVGKKADENAREIVIEFVNNENVNKDKQEIHNKYANDVKFEETEQKTNNDYDNGKSNLEVVESETNLSDVSKYETEFLDLQFDSDSDDNLTNDLEVSKYNIEIPKHNKEIPNYDMEFSEYNMQFPNNGMENTDYNFPCNNTNTIFLPQTKKRKVNHKKGLEVKENTQNEIEKPLKLHEIEQNSHKDNLKDEQKFFMKNLATKETQIETENVPFLIHDTNRVTCKLCQKELSLRSIYTHMGNCHPGADWRKVKCELCDAYVMKERLKRHRVVMHGEDCFRCGYCKTEYDSKEELLDHVSTCTAKKRKRKAVTDKRKELIVECDVCSKSMQRASLRLHKEVKHAGLGPVCEHCGRRFGNKFRLSEHLRAKHGYEKYKCSMCEFLSASRAAIRNHERRHRGEKPFVCEQCDAKFHAAHLLAQHRQSHRTEKNMKCDQCPAAFKANNTLHMHKITCHNTNTYQCPMCPRTYSARHYAVKHLRAVHRHTGAVGPLLVGAKQPRGPGGKSPA